MLLYKLPKKEPDRVSPGFKAWDIAPQVASMNVALIEITDRYPIRGAAWNWFSTMSVLILEGEVIYHQFSEESTWKHVSLSKGAHVIVPPEVAYFWLPQSVVQLYVVSSPPWLPEQHEIRMKV